VEALERTEMFIGIFHVEPCTVVAHKVDCLVRLVLDAEFDIGVRAFGRKFHHGASMEFMRRYPMIFFRACFINTVWNSVGHYPEFFGRKIWVEEQAFRPALLVGIRGWLDHHLVARS
jgi:hypothetical protein